MGQFAEDAIWTCWVAELVLTLLPAHNARANIILIVPQPAASCALHS